MQKMPATTAVTKLMMGRDDGDDRPEERIGHQNRVCPGLRRRDQKRHARGSRGALAAHFRDHRHHRAAAQRHRHADASAHRHRLQAVIPEPAQNRLPRDEHMHHAGQEKPEQQHGRQKQEGRPKKTEEFGRGAHENHPDTAWCRCVACRPMTAFMDNCLATKTLPVKKIRKSAFRRLGKAECLPSKGPLRRQGHAEAPMMV